ncbi:hypothetical protein LPJ73_005442, partial [Coemansia sp. RSA 2703]
MDIPASMQHNAAMQHGIPMLVPENVASAPSPLPIYGGGSSSSASHMHHMVRYRHSCEHCRKRKIKCSGTRPVCDHCLRRSIACIYKPLARTRRTPSLAGSPATHGYSQPHAAEMFYDPSGNLAPQPMAIPGLSPAYHPTPSSLSPGLRYASAPAPNVDSTGFAQMFHETLSQQQQQQGNMLRPANAIPPYLLAAGAPVQSPDCSPFAFAQGMSAFPSPADYSGRQPGSFNSAHSDLSDIL